MSIFTEALKNIHLVATINNKEFYIKKIGSTWYSLFPDGYKQYNDQHASRQIAIEHIEEIIDYYDLDMNGMLDMDITIGELVSNGNANIKRAI